MWKQIVHPCQRVLLSVGFLLSFRMKKNILILIFSGLICLNADARPFPVKGLPFSFEIPSGFLFRETDSLRASGFYYLFNPVSETSITVSFRYSDNPFKSGMNISAWLNSWLESTYSKTVPDDETFMLSSIRPVLDSFSAGNPYMSASYTREFKDFVTNKKQVRPGFMRLFVFDGLMVTIDILQRNPARKADLNNWITAIARSFQWTQPWLRIDTWEKALGLQRVRIKRNNYSFVLTIPIEAASIPQRDSGKVLIMKNGQSLRWDHSFGGFEIFTIPDPGENLSIQDMEKNFASWIKNDKTVQHLNFTEKREITQQPVLTSGFQPTTFQTMAATFTKSTQPGSFYIWFSYVRTEKEMLVCSYTLSSRAPGSKENLTLTAMNNLRPFIRTASYGTGFFADLPFGLQDANRSPTGFTVERTEDDMTAGNTVFGLSKQETECETAFNKLKTTIPSANRIYSGIYTRSGFTYYLINYKEGSNLMRACFIKSPDGNNWSSSLQSRTPREFNEDGMLMDMVLGSLKTE